LTGDEKAVTRTTNLRKPIFLKGAPAKKKFPKGKGKNVFFLFRQQRAGAFREKFKEDEL